MHGSVAEDQLVLKILASLNEAQARWYIAKEALARGRGGLKEMHELTGMSRPTILKGIRELRERRVLSINERVRRPGAGRKRIETVDPRFTKALEAIMGEKTAGDPMSLLRWTNKSTTSIADQLTRQGYQTSADTVGRRLREMNFSLQANVKNLEGDSPVERDEQFRYINKLVKQFRTRGEPVLSIDSKKKERVGNFKNPGKTWRQQGNPHIVNVYDFPNLGIGTAIPYGAYDGERNEGFVNVGMTHDTAEFAVASLKQWWILFGRKHYSNAHELLLCADGGGSNGSRNRSWKYHLQKLADKMGINISVCHYPPGTSKWNKIEHRMFSFISMNWKGEPLVSYETVVNLIGATKTRTGLKVKAQLDENEYEAGVKISDAEMSDLDLMYHKVHPRWNYTISSRNQKQDK